MLHKLNFFDFLLSNIFRVIKLKNNKLNVGICSPFLPVINGGAIISYYLVKELQNDTRINIFLIPVSNILKRRLFKNSFYAKLTSKFLDYVVFINAETVFVKFFKSGADKNKIIVYETLHEPFDCELTSLSNSNKARLELIKKIPLIINPTEWANREHIRYGKDSVYVPYGIDLNFFKRQTLIKDFAKKRVLFVSRVCYYKGIKQFLETIPLVLQKYPEVIFEIHGVVDDSPQKFHPSIDSKDLINKYLKMFPLNLKHYNYWCDVKNLPKIYESALALVYPSNSEGFGLPLIEAMACDVPVIVLDKPPMNEIIVNKKTGFCLPISAKYKKQCDNLAFPHPKDIADKIIWLIEHPFDAIELGKNGRKRVEEYYDIKKVAVDFVDAILSIKRIH